MFINRQSVGFGIKKTILLPRNGKVQRVRDIFALVRQGIGNKGVHPQNIHHILSNLRTILRCREAEISFDAPLPIHTDGEPLFLRKKMTVGLLPDKIRIITI